MSLRERSSVVVWGETMRILARLGAVFIGFVGSFLTCAGLAFEEDRTFAYVGGGLVFSALVVWVRAGKRRAGQRGYRRRGDTLKTFRNGNRFETEPLVVRLSGSGDHTVADAAFRGQIREHGGLLPKGRRLTEFEVDAVIDALDDMEMECPFCHDETSGPWAEECDMCGRSIKGVRVPIRAIGGRFPS